jgi:hypothetical protein
MTSSKVISQPFGPFAASSFFALEQLHLELDRWQKKAKSEIKSQYTQSLGILRLDLVDECRRRLTFLTYMLKDAEEHPERVHLRKREDER